MIFDVIKNAHWYYGAGHRIEKGLRWLQTTDIAKLEPGRHEIDGDDCFALVMNYETKLLEQGAWEAHRKYLDIQYVASGTEKMGYANIGSMQTSVEYDETKDLMFLKGEGDFLVMRPGSFGIFGPEDVHMPAMALDAPRPVKKIVVKVRV